MPTVDLTPCLVRESKAQDRAAFLFDRSLPGVGRCIHPSGRKVWMVQARIKGAQPPPLSQRRGDRRRNYLS